MRQNSAKKRLCRISIRETVGIILVKKKMERGGFENKMCLSSENRDRVSILIKKRKNSINVVETFSSLSVCTTKWQSVLRVSNKLFVLPQLRLNCDTMSLISRSSCLLHIEHAFTETKEQTSLRYGSRRLCLNQWTN